jgi:hypothetical protein
VPIFSHSMANPTPLFNRVAFIVFLAAALLLFVYSDATLPIAAIAFWILGFDAIRTSVGWNWSRNAAKENVGEEFKRLLVQDLVGWKLLGAFLIVLINWALHRSPVDIPRLVVFVLGLSVASGALREWRLRSEKEAPKAKAVVFVLLFWALYSANASIASALPVVDLFGFLFRYWLMLPLGLLGAFVLYQAVRLHLRRSERLMDADD